MAIVMNFLRKYSGHIYSKGFKMLLVNQMVNKINDNKMLKMVAQGYNQVKIAEYFGVSKQAVNKRLIQHKFEKLIYNKSWI